MGSFSLHIYLTNAKGIMKKSLKLLKWHNYFRFFSKKIYCAPASCSAGRGFNSSQPMVNPPGAARRLLPTALCSGGREFNYRIPAPCGNCPHGRVVRIPLKTVGPGRRVKNGRVTKGSYWAYCDSDQHMVGRPVT